ncbi:hypothetical protein LTR95_012654 [Oleoguttula sp. CCFEE 5521]
MSGRGRGREGYGKDSGQQSRGGFRGGSGSARGGRGGPPHVPLAPFTPDYRAVEDTAVTQREDALLDKSGEDSAVTLPRRPAYGSQGQRLLLWTNYFRLQVEGTTLCRYAVSVKKGGKDAPRGLMKRIIQLLVECQLKDIHLDAVSDFRSTLIFRRSLNDDLNFNVVYRAEGEFEPEDDAPQYQVLLEPSGTLNMSELVDYSTSTTVGISLSQSQELLQALNIIVGHASRTDPNTVTVGRNRRRQGRHRTGADQRASEELAVFNCKASYRANQRVPQLRKRSAHLGTFLTPCFCRSDPYPATSAPSVASIVSSVDRTLNQWPAAIRVQEARKEMITDLTKLFQGQLSLWRSKNRSLPANLILYRDGVSEGQYQVVLDNELPAIKKAISNVYSPAEVKQGVPRLSIIIVGKRHHTRFYPTEADDADKTGNSKHGLVVDRGVTNFCNWDFFLQAHSALHGTAKPAHYYVIYDEVLRRLNPEQGQAGAADALEKMTHGLCYLFGRATSAVSICPPAYYADLVCERARCYLSSHFAPSSGSATPASESSGSAGISTAGRPVTLHDAIKHKMFYI